MKTIKNQTWIIIILALLYLLTILTLYSSKLEITVFWSGMTGISTAFAVVFTGLQIYQSLEIKRKEKSIELAREFAELLYGLSFIESVLNKIPNYTSLINRHSALDFKEFRLVEFIKLYPNTDDQHTLLNPKEHFDKIFPDIALIYIGTQLVTDDEKMDVLKFAAIKWDSTILVSKHIEEALMLQPDTLKESLKRKIERIDIVKAMTTGNVNLDGFDSDEIEFLTHLSNKIKSDSLKMIRLKMKITTGFTDITLRTLNKCEYFAMSFNVNLADDKVVYQSLHQVLLRVIRLLYPMICDFNKNTIADHYYDNVIQLYNRWSNMYEQQCAKARKKAKNNIYRSNGL